MRERLKHKYALSEQGVNDMIKAVIIVTIANLAFMVPVGLLYLLASDILNGGIPSSKLPMYIGGMVISILLIIITTYFQYNATFLATYVESGVRRRTLAEKLRKIPLSFFGKKDLADLTSTIMGDCAWLETASSHFFPQLFGSMCSTTIVTICLFFFNVKMTLAAVWVLPVAFFVVFGARPISHRLNENAMKYKLECQDGIQEGLETVRDLKSYNATNTYMEGLNKKIQAVEKHAVVSEAINAMFVCLSQLILKVGIGTTTLVGGILFAKGEIDALTFFMYLLVVSRMYDPFQVALENLSAIISTDTQCKRMDEILSHEEQDGNKTLSNQGYDINFDHVGFSYDGNEQILKDVSFTAKQGEVTALIGPSGSGKTTVAKALQKKLGRNTMLISQDEVRRNMLWVDDGIDTKALPLMAELLRYGREHSEFSILEGIMYDEWYRSLFELANELYGSNVYAYYFDLSFEETVRRHNTRNREFGEKDMRRWWREKDFSSALREQAITCEMDTDSIVEKIYSDLNADRKAIAFMSI